MSDKKILLFGDSVMFGVGRLRGYGYFLQQRLTDKAEVFLPKENCQGIRESCSLLETLIPDGEDKFDVIHWNNGLWDVLRFAGNPNPHTPINLYKEKIAELFERFKEMYPKADIFFATTTPVPEHLQKAFSYRRNTEIVEYNTVACNVLDGKVKAVDDLYTAALKLGDDYRSDDGLHYSEEGAKYLAEVVCDFLLKQDVMNKV